MDVRWAAGLSSGVPAQGRLKDALAGTGSVAASSGERTLWQL